MYIVVLQLTLLSCIAYDICFLIPPLKRNFSQKKESRTHFLTLLQVTSQANSVYTGPMVQTISNPDGTVSIVQVDPSNPVIQLPDGTTAHVQGIAHVSTVLYLLISAW